VTPEWVSENNEDLIIAAPSCVKKSNLHYTRPIITLSGVTSERCPSPRHCAKVHTIKVATVASRWQRVGDLIGLEYEPHASLTRSERLTTCSIWPVPTTQTKTSYSLFNALA